MTTQQTPRGGEATDFSGKHLNLVDIKKRRIENRYLYDDVPRYPKPELHVSHLKHETGPDGLTGIHGDSGFRGSKDNFLVWFNLAVGPEEIRSAEKRLLEETFPELQEVETSNNFLWKFATSPAFSEKSLYGSFRFTFPLQEVLNAYSQQFCSGDRPVMRVYRTSVFKQEVEYVVLVHRPKDDERFSNYPLLEDQPQDAVCSYRDEHFIWNSQAMSQTHSFEMEDGEGQINVVPVNKQYYVWDVVSIALHLEPGEVLRLTKDQLRKYLTHCKRLITPYTDKRKRNFKDLQEAQLLVEGLWPSTQLMEQTSLQEQVEDLFAKMKI